MTSLDDPMLKGRIDAYLTRLRRALVNLPPAEVAEIVREIHGHIVERAAHGKDHVEAQRVERPRPAERDDAAAANLLPGDLGFAHSSCSERD